MLYIDHPGDGLFVTTVLASAMIKVDQLVGPIRAMSR